MISSGVKRCWETGTKRSPHSRSHVLCSTYWRAAYLQRLFGMLLYEGFVSCSPFMYIRMVSRVIILWMVIHCYFIVSFWHTPLLVGFVLFCFVLVHFEYFFTQKQDHPCASCICPAPVLESAISLWSPGSFYRRMETKVRAVGTHTATRLSLHLGPLSLQQGNTYVCINLCIYAYL